MRSCQKPGRGPWKSRSTSFCGFAYLMAAGRSEVNAGECVYTGERVRLSDVRLSLADNWRRRGEQEPESQ